MKYPRRLLLRACISALLMGAVCAYGAPAAWKPHKNVELIVPTGPGSGVDRTMRLIQKILQEEKLVGSTMSVVNKPGGGGALGWNYLGEHAGDAHYVEIATATLLTNHIIGRSPADYTNFTPLAILSSEYVAFAVNGASPLHGAQDLVGRLRKDPASVSFALAPGLGNNFHVALALFMKAAGGDPRKLKVIAFSSSGNARTALLGDHVDVVSTGASNIIPYLKGGQLRIIGIAAPHRMGGPLADVPTLKEQGVNVVTVQWRGLLGAKGISAAQVAFWNKALAQMVKSKDWKDDLAHHALVDSYMSGDKAKQFLDEQYTALKSALAAAGMAK